MRRFALAVAVAAVALALSACRDSAAPTADLTGTWSLQSIDGAPVPGEIGNTGLTLHGGSITFEAGTRFTARTCYVNATCPVAPGKRQLLPYRRPRAAQWL